MPDQTEPGLPAPSAPAGPVGDSEARSEIKAMQTDPTNALHNAWKEQGASHPDIEALYIKAYGRTEIDGPNAPADQSDQTTQSDIFLEGPNPEKEKTLADLKTYWGADFDAKVEAARVGTGFFIENNPELVSKVLDMGLGNDQKILDALAVIGAKVNERKG